MVKNKFYLEFYSGKKIDRELLADFVKRGVSDKTFSYDRYSDLFCDLVDLADSNSDDFCIVVRREEIVDGTEYQ